MFCLCFVAGEWENGGAFRSCILHAELVYNWPHCGRGLLRSPSAAFLTDWVCRLQAHNAGRAPTLPPPATVGTKQPARKPQASAFKKGFLLGKPKYNGSSSFYPVTPPLAAASAVALGGPACGLYRAARRAFFWFFCSCSC